MKERTNQKKKEKNRSTLFLEVGDLEQREESGNIYKYFVFVVFPLSLFLLCVEFLQGK